MDARALARNGRVDAGSEAFHQRAASVGVAELVAGGLSGCVGRPRVAFEEGCQVGEDGRGLDLDALSMGPERGCSLEDRVPGLLHQQEVLQQHSKPGRSSPSEHAKSFGQKPPSMSSPPLSANPTSWTGPWLSAAEVSAAEVSEAMPLSTGDVSSPHPSIAPPMTSTLKSRLNSMHPVLT